MTTVRVAFRLVCDSQCQPASPKTLVPTRDSLGAWGLQATAPVLEEQRSAPSDPFVFQPHLSLGYSSSGPYGEHVIDLTEQPAGTDEAKAELPSYEVPGVARQVTIEGKSRTVFLLKADERPVGLTAFAVEIDRTLVSGRATMSLDDIVAMLSQLRRVN